MVVWGAPDVTRSFLYVADAAEGIRRVLEAPDHPAPLNLTSTQEVTMEELIHHITSTLGYHGRVVYDATQPTGHRRRVFDTTRLEQHLGWRPPTGFFAGLDQTIAWHLQHVALPTPGSAGARS